MSKRLDGMRNNPRDRRIADVEAVCREACVACHPPTGGGGHYKVSHSSQPDIVTIPMARPVDPVYIRRLVKFLDRVAAARTGKVS